MSYCHDLVHVLVEVTELSTNKQHTHTQCVQLEATATWHNRCLKLQELVGHEISEGKGSGLSVRRGLEGRKGEGRGGEGRGSLGQDHQVFLGDYDDVGLMLSRGVLENGRVGSEGNVDSNEVRESARARERERERDDVYECMSMCEVCVHTRGIPRLKFCFLPLSPPLSQEEDRHNDTHETNASTNQGLGFRVWGLVDTHTSLSRLPPLQPQAPKKAQP